MALPTGTLSLSQVNTELSQTSTQIISLNDTNVRTLAGKASGVISMSDLQGKSSTFAFSPTLASSVNNYNLNSALTAAGWNGVKPVVANVTINSGVEVGSTSATVAAFLINSLPAGSTVMITNNGIICGIGGKSGQFVVNQGIGGPGGIALQTAYPITLINNNIISGGGGGGGLGGDTTNGYCQGSDGGAGGAGGSAIVMSANITLYNNGILAGGGGGGGGGASYQQGTANGSFSSAGGGGGGGRGYKGGGGGYISSNYYGGCSYGYVDTASQAARGGTGGGNGSWGSAGGGGTGGYSNGQAGAGATGGSLGAAGGTGGNAAGNIYRYGGAAGAAGRAVTINGGTLTLATTGTIYGAYQ